MNMSTNLTFLGANENPYSFVDKVTKVKNEGVSHTVKFMDIESNEVLTFKLRNVSDVANLKQFQNCLVELSLTVFKGVNQVNFVKASQEVFK